MVIPATSRCAACCASCASTPTAPGDAEGHGGYVGWGFALTGNLNMRTLWSGFGGDQLTAMAYYGEGIGRYFDSADRRQSAYSNIGCPASPMSPSPAPSYGATIGYRHYWAPRCAATRPMGMRGSTTPPSSRSSRPAAPAPSRPTTKCRWASST